MSKNSQDPESLAHLHHFESPLQQYQASSLGMWVFLITEIMFFGGLFLVYTIYRAANPEAFAAGSHHLDIKLGGFNTVVLIGSSLTMALAVHAAELGKKRSQVVYLVSTLVLGAIFLGVKAIEYSHKFHEHLVPGPHFHFAHAPREVQLFYSLYFAMTGMHAFHMIIGMGILIWLIRKAAQGGFTKVYHTPVEIFGLYWHFVDIVWIFLFPLLYLLGRH